MHSDFVKYLYEHHNTWPDVAALVAAYGFIVALVYVWRTTGKKPNA